MEIYKVYIYIDIDKYKYIYIYIIYLTPYCLEWTGT